MGSLNQNATIRFLASDLKLGASSTPVEDILDYCERLARKKLKGHTFCGIPAQLLSILADAFSTRFEEVNSDGELQHLMGRYKKNP